MFGHPVVDQAIHRHGLDIVAIAVYAIAFAVVAFATSRRPAYGIVALVLADPFALYRDVSETTLTLPKVVLLAFAAALAVRRDARAAFADTFRIRAVRVLLGCAGLVVLATGLSIAQAEHAAPAVRETLKACEYALIFACVAIAARLDPAEGPVRFAFAAVLAAVAASALSQEIFGAPSGLWFFNHPIPRIAGPLEGPNQLAGYLGLTMPVVAAFVVIRGPRRGELAVLCASAMALVLTLSRSGVLATIVALGIVIALAPSAGRRAALLSLAGGAVAGLGVLVLYGSTSLLARFSSFAEVERSGGVGTRAQLWHAAIALWRQHPWLGIGAGNFELEIAKVGPAGVRTHANSLYLQALVEGGAPLLAATLATVVASIAAFARGPFRDPFVLGAFAGGIGLALHQVFDFLTFYPKVGAMFWIVLGLAATRVASSAASLGAQGRGPLRRTAAGRLSQLGHGTPR